MNDSMHSWFYWLGYRQACRDVVENRHTDTDNPYQDTFALYAKSWKNGYLNAKEDIEESRRIDND